MKAHMDTHGALTRSHIKIKLNPCEAHLGFIWAWVIIEPCSFYMHDMGPSFDSPYGHSWCFN